MKHKTSVYVTRRTARQVGLRLDGVAAGRSIRHLAFVLEDDPGDEYVVLQILAHTGQVLDDLNSKTAERLRFSYAREHQKLRAMDGTGSQDHFLAGRDVLYFAVCHQLDAQATTAFEVQFHRVGVEQQSQIRPGQSRP